MKYNYLETVTADALEYIRDCYTTEEIAQAIIEDRDQFAEKLNDEMWIVDSVTGNGSGSYTFNSRKALDFIAADPDTVAKALREFCVEAETIADKFLSQDWEYFDVTARCYCLYGAIDAALDELENDPEIMEAMEAMEAMEDAEEE